MVTQSQQGKATNRRSAVCPEAPQPLPETKKAGEVPIIQVRHLRKEYPNSTPLADVNLDVYKGDIISVIGPSGTGKSTLLFMINQLVEPTSGNVWLDQECITHSGADIPAARQRLGLVFQNFNLFDSLCTIENVMDAPVRLLKMDRQAAYDRGMDLLTMVGLEDKSLNFPDELSGGQKQRVAIARAIAMDPEILLLDEPTSALDPKMVQEVQSVIVDLAESGMTMIIVTHEMEFAQSVSTRVLYMDEGIIYEQGSPDHIFSHPQKPKTRQFVQRLKQFSQHIEVRDLNFAQVIAEIAAFARRNLLSKRGNDRLCLLWEELIVRAVVDNLSIADAIDATLQYSERNHTVEVAVTYSGAEMDPFENCDEFTLAIIDGIASARKFSYDAGVNTVELSCRIEHDGGAR